MLEVNVHLDRPNAWPSLFSTSGFAFPSYGVETKQTDVCSNAGFLFFGTVLRAIAAADALPDGQPGQGDQAAASLPHGMIQSIKGLILDSAPCRLTPDISARFKHAAAPSYMRKDVMLWHSDSASSRPCSTRSC